MGFVPNPTDIVLVMDRTKSMGDIGKMDAAKRALAEVVNTVANSNNPNIRIALVSYNTSATLDQDFTKNYNAVKIAINGMTPDGRTSIGAGLLAAGIAIENQPTMPARNKFVVIASDGYQNTNPSIATGLSHIGNNVMIYTVGIGNTDTLDERALTSIAEGGGSKNGLYFRAPVTYLTGIFKSVMNQIIGNFTLQNVTIDFIRDDTTYTSFSDAIPLSSSYNSLSGAIRWDNLGNMTNSREKELLINFKAQRARTDISLNTSPILAKYTVAGEQCSESIPVNILSVIIYDSEGSCSDSTWTWNDPDIIKCDTLKYPQVSNCGFTRWQQGDIKCAQCADYIDNDLDGKIDYPLDLGCTNWKDNSEYGIPRIKEF
jgi:hypothetical protein